MTARNNRLVAMPRVASATAAGLVLIMALAGAAPRVDDSAYQPAPGWIDPTDSRVIPYAEHPASSIVDRDTRTLLATRHIPGFGGAYIDAETERLQVWLTRPTEKLGLLARAALASERKSAEVASAKVVVRQAKYTFAQLKAWKDTAMELFSLPDVVMLGIDERTNRLQLGIRGSRRLTREVADHLAGLGIPAEAVTVASVQQQFGPQLRDDHRPLAGATQIQFQVGFAGLGTGTCTLGFPAIRGGVTGFVTNAHCSRSIGEVDDGRYWQATRPAHEGNQVGTEVTDPPFFTGGPCPADAVCSFTDANYVRAHEGVTVDRGRLAAVGCCRSTDWNGEDTWRVSDSSFTFVGHAVRKVGRTTGTTIGTVDNVCDPVQVRDTNIVLLCQDVARMTSDHGDSGSPVFETTHSPALDDVRAVGILWGGGVVDGVSRSVLTPAPFIRDVIGAQHCAPGFGC